MSDKLRTQVQAHEFTITTGASPDDIRRAGSRACEAGKRSMQSSVKEVAVAADRIQYEIKGPGGLVRQMQVALRIAPVDGTRRQVSLTVGDFLTMRPVMFGFIPSGPKRAPAMKSLERFSARLRQELS